VGIKDFIRGATEQLAKLTPDPAEDLLFGKKRGPATPTNDQQARDLIDATIGREPDDAKLVNDLYTLGLTTRLISAIDDRTEGLFTGGPYDPDTRARWASGQIKDIPDPYTIADMDLQRLFQDNPRMSLLYAREFDPQNSELMPYLVESQTKRHGGLLSTFKNVVSDIAGRPIGGALELLGKPAKWAETEYGTRFVWNDIPDASLRRTMAKYTYEARLNFRDWNGSWERRARLKAEDIENQGLRGDAASSAFEDWIRAEGNPGAAAAVTDLISQMALDPLWLVPGDAIFRGAGAGIRGVSGVEKGKGLSRLFRLGSVLSARSTFGFDSIREVINADELSYRTAQIATPGLRGSMLWLFEKTPARFGDSVSRETALLLSGPLSRAQSLDEQIDVLAQFNEAMSTGRVAGKAIDYFGASLFDSPIIAKFQSQLSAMPGRQAVEGVLEGLTRHPEIATMPTNELNTLLIKHVEDSARALATEAQNAIYPQWFTRRWLPMVAWQKMTMGVFTLSRPGFVLLNLGNNLFTYMWQAARHPADAVQIFKHSIGAELGSKELPAQFRSLAEAAGLDPVSIERTIAGNVTRQELLGQLPGQAFRLDDEYLDIKRAKAMASQSLAKPLQDLAPFRFRDLLSWPVLAASRLDRATRRATFYQSLNEQLNLGTARNHVIDGVIPALRDRLIGTGMDADLAQRWEDHMITSIRSYLHSSGGTLADPDKLRAAWMAGVNDLVAENPRGYVSAYNYGMRFATERGIGEVGATYWMRDLDPVIKRVHDDVISQIGTVDVPTLLNRLDNIADEYWTYDNIAANATKTAPVLRPSTDYSTALALTEAGIREDMIDAVKHIDRLAARVLPDWTGNAFARRKILGSADNMIQARLKKLAEIRRKKMEALSAGAANTETWRAREAQLWDEYRDITRETQIDFFNAVRSELGAVDQATLKQVEDWYATMLKTQQQHKKIVDLARETDTPEAWTRAGEKVSNLYAQAAERRANIFQVAANEVERNMGYTRPSAPLVRQVEDYLEFVKTNLPTDIATALRGGESLTGNPSAREILQRAAEEVAERGPDIARQLVANARAKTDFVMLDYDNQIGLDSALQMFFPYEFFPTRTAFNWGIRVARTPGAGGALALAIMNPAEYGERYGMPERLKYKIPIPMPFLQDWLRGMPVIGGKIENADFANLYWVDPLSYMFPLTGFRDQFDDEAKTGVGLGGIADYFEQNTPLGISPYSKIIGGYTGFLNRDAWTNSLFNGGPFGIPMSAYGAAAGKWLQTGDGSDVPDEEKDLFSQVGYFSRGFLAQILGMNGNRFDNYRRERALSSLEAEGKITNDESLEALRTHKGPAWRMAVKAAESEKFLADFTGWLGFRTTGSLKGEQIRLGEKAQYNKAAAEGRLEEFFESYPWYQTYNIAVRGISDPKERQKELETQLYYRDIENLVDAPYQRTLDELELRITSIRMKDSLTESDVEQIKFYNDQVGSIRNEQRTIREMVGRAYPNRNVEPSLLRPPKERALSQVAERWYNLRQGEGDGVASDETYEDFLARRESFLRGFPAKQDGESEDDWQALFVTYQTTLAKYNLLINKAYNEGDFDRGEQLREEREAMLEAIHEQSVSRVTRYDVEQYLAQFQRRLTPAEVEFNDASAMFDMWMALVSDSSPLSDRQQAAVSAYFRAQPLLQKHYNASVLDLRSLNGDQLIALARRREIKNHYNSLGTDDAKIDYMRSVAAEYNEANAILGLPPVTIIDVRPEPPNLSFRDPYMAQGDFSGGRDFEDFLAGGTDDIQDDRPMQMSEEDILRYVDAAISRGY